MKRLLSIILCIMCMISVVGCDDAKKIESLTSDQFKKIMEERDLDVQNLKNSNTDEKFEEIYVVRDSKRYNIDYYKIDSQSNAEEIFKDCVDKLKEKHKDDETNIKTERDSNRKAEGNATSKSLFKLTTSKYYYYLLRRNNTFVYITANVEYKDEIKDMEDELDF